MLVRSANQDDPQHILARDAIDELRSRGEVLHIVPQCLYEFYSVATRPTTARGGLGYTPTRAKSEMNRLRGLFNLCPDNADVLEESTEMITDYGVSGVQAHDARLVAAMRVHGISSLITFNSTDFRRYSGIIVLHPDAILVS